MEKQLEILLEFYKIIDNTIKESQERNWKIRLLGITIWGTLISFSYKELDLIIMIFSLMQTFIFLLLELGNKVLENKNIEKKIDLEKVIESYFVEDPNPEYPTSLLRSNVTIANRNDYLKALKQWRFSLYYITMIIISIVGLIYLADSNKLNKKEINCSSSVIINLK